MDEMAAGDLDDLFQGSDFGDGLDDAGCPAPSVDDQSEKPALRGFRQRWKRRSQEVEADVAPSPSLIRSSPSSKGASPSSRGWT